MVPRVAPFGPRNGAVNAPGRTRGGWANLGGSPLPSVAHIACAVRHAGADSDFAEQLDGEVVPIERTRASRRVKTEPEAA